MNFVTSSRMAAAAPSLFNDLVRLQDQGLGDRHSERFRHPEVDDELELGRLLDGKVSWFRALEDLVDVGGRAPIVVGEAGPVCQEAARLRELAPRVHGRYAMLGGQLRAEDRDAGRVPSRMGELT